jgi:flagellar hook-basal body complex protein FliE
MTAIDPSLSIGSIGNDWQIGGVESPAATPTSGSSSFGDMLSKSIESLQNTQDQASQAATALATGQASDPTAVVTAVERAQLAMQLASQIRNKAVEATNDIFHTQV